MIDVVIFPLCSLCPKIQMFLRNVLLRKKFGQTLKDGYWNFSTYKQAWIQILYFFRKYDDSSIHRLENQITSFTKHNIVHWTVFAFKKLQLFWVYKLLESFVSKPGHFITNKCYILIISGFCLFSLPPHPIPHFL